MFHLETRSHNRTTIEWLLYPSHFPVYPFQKGYSYPKQKQLKNTKKKKVCRNPANDP